MTPGGRTTYHLVCARAADADFVTRGADFTHHCSFCGERVVLAQSSQKRVQENPEMKIMCQVCFVELKKRGAEICLTASPDDVARELRNPIPNLWKNRQ